MSEIHILGRYVIAGHCCKDAFKKLLPLFLIDHRKCISLRRCESWDQ